MERTLTLILLSLIAVFRQISNPYRNQCAMYHLHVCHPPQEKRRVHFEDEESEFGSISDLDSVTATSSDGLLGESQTQPLSVRRCLSSKWLCLGHLILFTFSATMLGLALNVKTSTLNHVQKYSAWCR